MNTLACKLKHSLKTVLKNVSHFLFQLDFFNAFMQVSIEYVYVFNQHQQCRQTFHGRLSKYNSKVFPNLSTSPKKCSKTNILELLNLFVHIQVNESPMNNIEVTRTCLCVGRGTSCALRIKAPLKPSTCRRQPFLFLFID